MLLSLILVILTLIESIVGSCQVRVSMRAIMEENQSTGEETAPGPFQQIQLELLCDRYSCFLSDYYNTTCHTDDAMDQIQILGSYGKLLNLCEDTCIGEIQKEDATVQLRTTTKLAMITSSVTNSRPTNSSCMATTTIHTTVHVHNTTAYPTTTQSLGTPTPSIFLETANCSPCIQITYTTTSKISCSPCKQSTTTITSTITKAQEKTVVVTRTTTVWTPCTPTANSRQSTSCNLVTVVKPTTVSGRTAQPDLSQNAKSCSQSASSALGALLGIFMVLLALVTSGWIWTCWIVKKRGRMMINSKLNNFPNTLDTVTINNNTDTLKRLQNPLYDETPANSLLPSEAELQMGQGESEGTGPTYEIIPLPATINKRCSKKTGSIPVENDGAVSAGRGVSGGVVSPMNDDTGDNIRFMGGDNMNHYHQPEETINKDSNERNGHTDQENRYLLLATAEEKKEETVRENVYHVLESPLDNDEDYADPDEEEMNNIYHVLDGPTPKREEETERDKLRERSH